MSDLYTEVLVQKKFTGKDMAIKVGLIFLTVLLAVAGLLIIPWFLIGAVALGVVDYIFIPRLSVEFEYLYVNGELDIDKVFSRAKRKKAGRYDLSKMEIMAPANSHRLDSYNNNSAIKLVDYSSGMEDAKVYAMIIPAEKELQKVMFEPNDVMLQDIRMKLPRKVFMD
ncbi:MAG: DUF6106 family protein [Lachnospiraceae bacterium]|nr:DUF6106 family protein [Lachnospiraceae bacterium]